MAAEFIFVIPVALAGIHLEIRRQEFSRCSDAGKTSLIF
jgi:hypothetical protein